jgi:tetratricopeptide (TPR) repeat protein
MMLTRQAVVLIAILVLAVSFNRGCGRLVAQENTATDLSPHLGDLTFPNSGAPAAQRKFLIAVKLLHNFEYEEAVEAFRDCQKIDPNFGMAYWGQAMCYNHPLWGEQDLERARAALRPWGNVTTRKLSDRESGLLASLDILYGPGEKSRRDQGYANALEELSRKYPADHEIASFRALALLGICAGNRDTRVYMKAAAILEDVYRANPRHPGVLHYLIHCYDDPIHAPLGLRAARTYGTIAGTSAHAQHMPSHIYLPLGLWSEVIQSNEAAWLAGQRRLQRLNLGEADYDVHALHALQWLQYGYLQSGDYARALQLLDLMATIHRQKPTKMSKWYFALMRSAHVVDAPDWRRANMTIDMRGVELSAAACDLFANSLAAIRQGTTGSERALQELKVLRADAERRVEDTSHHHSSYFEGVYSASIRSVRIIETQLEALILLADGRKERAVERLKDAVSAEQRLPTGYGPPLPVKPSTELLGEVLLNDGRWEEAQIAFQKSLQRTPRRTASLVGLAHAARKAGDLATANRTDETLSAVLEGNTPYRGWLELPFSD